MIKWVEEFCDVDGYRCKMPIEYEIVGSGVNSKTYKKVKCNCHNVRDGKCNRRTECKHYIAAEEIIEE
jgi:preprotein translocase subunit Sec63